MKTKLITVLLFMLIAVIVLTGCGGNKEVSSQAAQQTPVELNVSAALGLKEALLDIQKDYEGKNPNIKIIYNLAASGILATQIEQGAPADLFIAAANKQLNDLQAKGLLMSNTRRPLVGNELVLITAKNAQLSLKSFQDIEKVKSFGLGAPETVPAGQYGMEVLKKIGIWDVVKDRAVLAKDVRTILTHVETGNVDGGIVFSTVAATSDKVVVVARAPAGSNEPIVFPAAVLSNAKKPQAADEFLTYLAGPEGMKVFVKYGFKAIGANQ
ncbi:molybdate ABC transporter substrate-binding protein [Sporomusa malonica]|uniref:Molybdate transport system substrate-binding protein n=1 Tax=Sporomusa malonica TaxID=112901 RepID=A0A1W2CVZ6_9FIRM|nr:molybdate ABC transporter substrate-binding protein [Sporomusa malonica]SMC89390.1 molybdate transport system substrate-binding protein [Sporomusa malonica]